MIFFVLWWLSQSSPYSLLSSNIVELRFDQYVWLAQGSIFACKGFRNVRLSAIVYSNIVEQPVEQRISVVLNTYPKVLQQYYHLQGNCTACTNYNQLNKLGSRCLVLHITAVWKTHNLPVVFCNFVNVKFDKTMKVRRSWMWYLNSYLPRRWPSCNSNEKWFPFKCVGSRRVSRVVVRHVVEQ